MLPSKQWGRIERPNKALVRRAAVDYETFGRRRQTLWLPAEQCLCVEAGLKSGLIDTNSRLTLVERDPAKTDQIRRKMSQWKWKQPPLLFEGELADLPIPYDVDYAFLDIYGTIEPQLARWMIESLAVRLQENAVVCVTHLYGWRNCRFLYEFADRFEERCPSLYEELYRRCDYDRQVTVPLILLKCTLSAFSFDSVWPVWYQDSRNSMIFYRLINFRKLGTGNSEWPPVSTILNLGPSRSIAMSSKNRPRKKVSERSQRALKAWETRRQQAQEEPVEASAVIQALSANKRGASVLLDRYVEQRVNEGFEENRIRAAIKAHVTRLTG